MLRTVTKNTVILAVETTKKFLQVFLIKNLETMLTGKKHILYLVVSQSRYFNIRIFTMH
jgi:hypothetical protein